MSGGLTTPETGGGFDFDAAFDVGDARPPAFDFGAEDPFARAFGAAARDPDAERGKLHRLKGLTTSLFMLESRLNLEWQSALS